MTIKLLAATAIFVVTLNAANISFTSNAIPEALVSAGNGNPYSASYYVPNLAITQFDPSLGTLTGFQFTFNYLFHVTADTTSGGAAYTSLGGNFQLNGNSVSSGSCSGSQSGGAAADLSFDVTCGPVDSGAQTFGGNFDPSAVTGFEGTGTIPFAWMTSPALVAVGSGTEATIGITSGSVAITYTYTPAPTPEPSTAGLVALGAFALGMAAKRKR